MYPNGYKRGKKYQRMRDNERETRPIFADHNEEYSRHSLLFFYISFLFFFFHYYHNKWWLTVCCMFFLLFLLYTLYVSITKRQIFARKEILWLCWMRNETFGMIGNHFLPSIQQYRICFPQTFLPHQTEGFVRFQVLFPCFSQILRKQFYSGQWDECFPVPWSPSRTVLLSFPFFPQWFLPFSFLKHQLSEAWSVLIVLWKINPTILNEKAENWLKKVYEKWILTWTFLAGSSMKKTTTQNYSIA